MLAGTLVGGGRVLIRLAGAALETMLRAAAETAPEECCGGLLGRGAGGALVDVVRACPMPNEAAVAARRRGFLMGAAAYRALVAEAEAAGLELVGFFHSHPGAEPVASAEDLVAAWPGFVHLIVGAQAVRGWRLTADRSGFQEERVEVEQGGQRGG
jgi:proteasome lid subunit RPN8/RPN11